MTSIRYKNGSAWPVEDLLFVIYMATNLLPIFAQVMNTYVLVLLVAVLNLFYVLSEKEILNKPSIYPLLIIPVITFVEELVVGAGLILAMYRLLRKTLLIFGGIYYLRYFNANRIGRIYHLFKLFLLITAITSIWVLSTDEYASRVLASIGDSKDSYAVSMNMKNLGGFYIVYLSVTIIPLLCCGIKNYKDKLLQIVDIVLLVAILIYVVSSAYSTAIIVAFLALGFSILLYKTKKTTTMGIMIMLCVIVICLAKIPIANVFYDIGHRLGGIVENRFTYVADTLMGIKSNSDANIRVYYYNKAWGTFLRHPLFGGVLFGDTQVSGHSVILDLMARYGCIGLLLKSLYYKSIYKCYYSLFKSINVSIYANLTIVICIILEILNPTDTDLTLMIMLPFGLVSCQRFCSSNAVEEEIS